MAPTANPWESESGLEMSGGTLLQPTVPLRLSEFDIQPESQWQYFYGALLAGMHGGNYRYTDFHPGNAGLDPNTGQFVILDPGGTLPTPLHPKEMSGDFLMPLNTLSADDFNAFLAGYVRQAYTDLDVKYPQYTRTLLEDIGGQILSSPEPGRPVLDLPDVLRQLHITLHDDMSLSFSDEPDPSQVDFSRLDDYLVVVFMLYLCGAPLEPLEAARAFLLAHLPKDPDIDLSWWAFAQFFRFADAQEADPATSNASAVAHSIVSRLITDTFARFDEFRKHVAIGAGEWRPNWALLAVICNRPQGFAPLDYVRLVDKVLAVIGYFVVRMDEHHVRHSNPAAKTRSLGFMQFYTEVLAATLGHPRWDEIRYVRAMQVFNGLSWSKECNAGEINAATRPELNNYFRMSHSLLALELKIFKNSVTQVQKHESGHPFWSLSWSALCRAREMLYATEPLLEEAQGLQAIPEDQLYHLRFILSDYGETLSSIVRSSSAVRSPFVTCIMKKTGEDYEPGHFLQELDWVKSLFDLVHCDPPSSFPTLIAAILTGRRFFRTNPRVIKQRR